MPEEKEKKFKTVLTVDYIKSGNKLYNVKGKILAYFKKSEKSKELSYGDVIVLKANVTEIPERLNPAQFDYKRFLAYKRIYHQAFLKDYDWIYTKENIAPALLKKLSLLREKIIAQIKMAVKTPDEQSIALALLIGSKTDLSDDLRQSFASAGAMHVLAVSGLHVGIISLVFGFLTKFLLKLKYAKPFYVVLNLCFIWCYAILTGLSPSVLRASAMFSFVIIGNNIGRIPNVYSSLYNSLFFLLLTDPLMISQVGFQLSYIAVLGIVAFQPRIYQLIYLKKIFILDKIWALTAVSIAAQLATFPLALLYFTIFPVYFLVSNLIVIPATTLIMYSGFAYLLSVTTGLNWLINALSYLFNFFLKFLNHSVLYIQNLPNGLIDEIYISPFMTIMIYVLILTAFFYFLTLNRRLILMFLLSLVIFFSGFTYWKIKTHVSREIIVYSIPQKSLIGFYDEKKIVFWGDSAILNDYSNLKYNTFRDIWKYGRKASSVIKIPFGTNYKDHNLIIQNQFCCFEDKVLSYLNEKLKFRKDSLKILKLDYLIVHPKDKNYVDRIQKYYKPTYMVINLNPDKKKAKIIHAKADESGIKCYNLAEKGALQIKFPPMIDFPETSRNISGRIREICSTK